MDLIKSSPTYVNAEKDLLPLIIELEASQKIELAHAAKVNAARNKLEEAKKAAMKLAVQDVEKKFATATP